MGQSRPLFVYFRSFLVTISIQIEKSVDGVLGIRTWAAGWKAQTKPQSYGGHIFFLVKLSPNFAVDDHSHPWCRLGFNLLSIGFLGSKFSQKPRNLVTTISNKFRCFSKILKMDSFGNLTSLTQIGL